MSCSKGSSNRTRPQKHQNRTVFKNNLHDTSKKTKLLNNLEVTGVCQRCKEIIEWKIKYKKYKTLTIAGKCVACEQRNIKHAYHVLCTDCARKKNVCTKCCKQLEIITTNNEVEENDSETKLQTLLKSLPERKRRTLLRHVKKQEADGNKVDNSLIESLISEMGNMDFNDDFSDDNSLSD